jgi:hypothetical protein
MVISFSFIAPRSARRDDSAALATEGADDDDFLLVEEAVDHVADLAFAVRLPDERRAIDHSPCVLKIDVVVAQIAFTFSFVPFECPNVGEQFVGDGSGHGRPLANKYCVP